MNYKCNRLHYIILKNESQEIFKEFLSVKSTNFAGFIIVLLNLFNKGQIMRVKIKPIFMIAFLIVAMLAVYGSVAAQSNSDEPPVVITFFWREGCSHCAAEKPFLQELMAQYPQIDLRAYEVYDSQANLDYLFGLGDAMGFETSGVPVTVIGDQSWVGFSDAIGAELSAAVAACSVDGCGDPADQYGLDTTGTVRSLQTTDETVTAEESTTSPFIWVLAVVALLLVSYGVGALLRQAKKKPARKRH
jgi:thiol-disulfide isomerase/thioredoxin